MATEEPSAAAPADRRRAAYERLVLDEYERVYGYFWWLSESRELAWDLTQETFVCAWRSLGTYNGRAPETVWLHAIAGNVWKQHLRRRPSEQMAGLDPAVRVADPSPSPHDCAAAATVSRRVEDAVRRLPEAYRQVVVLHYYQGLTHREVAAALGIGVGLVKWRIHQSLRRLERMLGPWQEVDLYELGS